jgi:hypothetical protein
MDQNCRSCISWLVVVTIVLTAGQLFSAQEAKPQEAKPPQHVVKPVRDAWKKAGFRYGWRGESLGFHAFVEDTGDNAMGDVPFFHIREWQPGVIKRLPAPEQPFGLDLSDFTLGAGMLQDLRGLARLHSLYLSADDAFPGLEHLAALPRLHTILTIGGKATDQMFKDLGAIKSLRNLQLLDTDPADADLSPLKNVHTLLVPYVSETELKQLAGLTNVKDFSTYGGEWPEAKAALLSRFKHLESLWVSGKLTDNDVKHLAGLTNLRLLRLSHATITDAGVKHLVGLKELAVLDLSRTAVTDVCLEHVVQLPKLEELNLYFNGISDDGLKHLAKLKHLHTLDIHRIAVTDAAVEHLAALKDLRFLEVGGLTPAGMARLMKALPKLKINTKPRHQFAVDEVPM